MGAMKPIVAEEAVYLFTHTVKYLYIYYIMGSSRSFFTFFLANVQARRVASWA